VLRAEANEKALIRLRKEAAVGGHAVEGTDGLAETTPGGVGMLVDSAQASDVETRALHIGEEETLRRFHEQRIARICRKLKLSATLAATAVTYFKRYCLHNSVMDCNPAVIAMLSIYVALKVEEVNLSADDLVSFVDKDAELCQKNLLGSVCADSILSVEISFLQGLLFHLICYHPFNSLGAAEAQFCLHAKRHRLRSDEIDSDIDEACRKMARDAMDVINSRVLFSDMCLTIKPGLIALGALVFCARKRGREEQLLKMLSELFRHAALTSSNVSGSTEDLDEICREKLADVERVAASINSMSDSKVELDVICALESRRKACEDWSRNPESEQYRRHAEQQRAFNDDRKREKYRMQKEKMRQEQDAFLAGLSLPDAAHRRSVDPMDMSTKKQKLV